MASILVVDDTPFWRDIAGEALRRSGFTVVTAGNGVEALAALRTHPVNLVILDVEMPQMQGLSFLQQLHQQAEWKNLPVIMLTGDMQKEHVILAKKLGAVEYLLKSRFSLPDLLSRVKHCLAAPAPAAKPPQIQAAPVQVQAEQPLKKTSSIATELPRLLTREQCITRAETALAGRNISMAAAQVISLATSPLTDVSELALRIGHDPVLSARVLQASTRASRATSRGVITTLPDAVKLLGCTTIRDIAASLGVFDAMPPASTDGFDPIRSWQHSLAVAKLCGQLAPAELSGTAYVVGLCHDLGEILFRTHFEDEYKRVLLAQTASGKPLHQVERTMLGLSHGQFSQTILRCMKIPDAIKLPIADYHDSILTGDHLREPLGRVLQLADLYATGMLMAPSEHAAIRPLTRAECNRAVGVDDPSIANISEILDEIQAMTVFYAKPSPDVSTPINQPLFTRQSAKLLVARDPGLSAFDPVCAMLESLAEISIQEQLPNGNDLNDYDGLVVLTRTESVAGFTSTDIAQATLSGGTQTLWLTGKCEASHSTPARLNPTLWPISLQSIASFIESVIPV